jgi:tetratricopeptide (TPR) repeat protein
MRRLLLPSALAIVLIVFCLFLKFQFFSGGYRPSGPIEAGERETRAFRKEIHQLRLEKRVLKNRLQWVLSGAPEALGQMRDRAREELRQIGRAVQACPSLPDAITRSVPEGLRATTKKIIPDQAFFDLLGIPLQGEDQYHLGLVYFYQRRFEEALQSVRQALEEMPESHSLSLVEGLIYHCLGENEQAVTSYERALKRKADFYQAWNKKGNALIQLRRYGEAREAYTEALRLNQDYAPVWYNRARLSLIEGMKKEALSDLRRAFEIDRTLKKIARGDDSFQAVWEHDAFKKLVK